MKTRLLRAVTALGLTALPLVLSAPLNAQTASDGNNQEIVVNGRAQIGEFGVDLTARDPKANPGDDFERYASGAWIDRTPIPSDRASTGSFVDLGENVNKQMQALITSYPGTSKGGALYQSFMDEKTLERIGNTPLMQDIASIRAMTDRDQIARFMGESAGKFGMGLFNIGPSPDPDEPATMIGEMSQSGIGLPDKDYYLNPQFAPQRLAYAEYMRRTFKALGEKNPVAAAEQVLALETYIAQLSWNTADRRDIDKTNNPYSSEQLAAYAPEFPWQAFFEGLGLAPQKKLVVDENTAFQRLARLFAKTDIETLKLWEQFHITDQASPYLNKAMVDSRFAFTKSLSGVTQNRDRWKRGVSLVNGSVGELVGQDYVGRHFPAIAKLKMEQLVANLKLAMADRIKANSWMSEPTKQAALAKLDNTMVMVGYPDSWRDYSNLDLSATDLYGNVQRAGKFNSDYQLAKIGKPVDRKLWFMSPQTVNAYNGGPLNEIVFPAAILQAPFFDVAADPAVNYGAIGVVIGHEISHSFDDQGRKIDAAGRIRDWWTAEDGQRFKAEAKRFGAQYGAFEVVPGAHINPDLTMGENIADFAGLNVALDAYHRSLNGKEAPVINGLTGDQRFFLGYAQVWRSKAREDALRNQVTTDPHSPARYRTIAPIRNLDAWYAAFGIKPGDKMYIAPEDRVKIW